MAFSGTGSTDCMIPSLLSISLICGCIPSIAFIFLAISTSGSPFVGAGLLLGRDPASYSSSSDLYAKAQTNGEQLPMVPARAATHWNQLANRSANPLGALILAVTIGVWYERFSVIKSLEDSGIRPYDQPNTTLTRGIELNLTANHAMRRLVAQVGSSSKGIAFSDQE